VGRVRRAESGRPGVASTVTTWDDETGAAEIVGHDDGDRILRSCTWTPWPEERWDGPVVGEAVWLDAEGNELSRRPILRDLGSGGVP
jgi:hypothetical protein